MEDNSCSVVVDCLLSLFFISRSSRNPKTRFSPFDRAPFVSRTAAYTLLVVAVVGRHTTNTTSTTSLSTKEICNHG